MAKGSIVTAKHYARCCQGNQSTIHTTTHAIIYHTVDHINHAEIST